jgi:hypothetical protein
MSEHCEEHSHVRDIVDTPRGASVLAASAAASVQLGLLTSANAKASKGASTSPASLGPIKQVDAGTLSMGYAEAGPADGSPVLDGRAQDREGHHRRI